MRLGILGVGRIGHAHARVVHAHPDVRAVVLSDVDTARANALAHELNGARAASATVADSAASLLAQVDGVVIATPTDTHAALIEQAVRARIPVFCEKPVALDLASTRHVVQLVAEYDAVVQIGFQRRFDAGYRAARAAVRAGAMGRVYSVRVAGHDPAPPAESYLPGSGGIFRDLHIHDFDIVRWVLGQDVTEVYADGAVLVDPMFARHDDVDTTAGTLRFRDGTLGVMTGGRHNPLGYDIRLELFGSRDSVTVGWDARTPMHSLEPGMPPAPHNAYAFFLDRFADAYRAELHAFVEVVTGRAENPCSVADAEQSLLVALACDRSRAERRPVTIAEIAAG
ncbi:MAG: Gfo/Idh/MocA family oxidoreductase [Gemmatimonadetes bacterium]|nr:Gfo/Idh/MocA family oxidoreductase [Gemmatimonadota bacterium]